MNRYIKQCKAFLLGAFFAFYCSTPAFGAAFDRNYIYDGDTNIFFGGASSTNVQPNILFILDNSGSMDNTITGTGLSRMQTMKNSFSALMDSISGVNIGMMRFNGPGGSILYPVEDIAGTADDFSPILSPGAFDSEDDATEAVILTGTDGDGSVDTSGATLSFGYDAGEVSFTGHDGTGQVDVRINESSDDGMGSSSSTDLTNDLKWCTRGRSCRWLYPSYLGFMFDNIVIPDDAEITSAYLVLTARGSSRSNGSDASLTLKGSWENGFNFNTSYSNELQYRYDNETVGSGVYWEINDTWNENQEVYSDDIKSIIQDIRDEGTWDSGEPMVIMARASGRRNIYGYDDSTGYAPRLIINYTSQQLALDNGGSVTVGNPTKKTMGVRFQDVGVPQGATVTNAYIQFTAAETSSTGHDMTVKISVETEDDASGFSSSTSDVTSRSTTRLSDSWSITETWNENVEYQTPDLTNIVQTIIDRSGWCGNNSMAFTFETETTDIYRRMVHSVDADGTMGPELIIEYDDSDVSDSDCINDLLEHVVSSSPSDAQQFSDNTVDNNWNSYDLEDGETVFRFDGLELSKDADILEAYISFTARYTDSESASYTITAEDNSDSSTFSENSNSLGERTHTSNSVTWNSSSTPTLGAWTSGNEYRTPDLSAVIEEVVANTDWEAGNAISFFFNGSGERYVYSYDGNAGAAAQLHLKVAHGDTVKDGTLTVREHAANLVNALDANTSTPIADSLYEAALYYQGEELYWSKARNRTGSSRWDYTKRVSHENSYRGGSHSLPTGCTEANLDASACSSEEITGTPVFISPITDACQANYIVLLTDGSAWGNDSQSLIRSMTGDTSCDDDYTDSELCTIELASWMAENDMAPSITGENTVKTYTIAFDLDSTDAKSYLEDLAEAGGGNYYETGSESDLINAFSAIVSEILATDASFVTPGTTVNQFNRLSHGNEIYYSVFRPSLTKRWSGNLKKYQMVDGQIVDANNEPAIDSDSSSDNAGFFKETAKSFWSDEVDGPSVALGGAAKEFVSNVSSRNVYTYFSGASTTLANNAFDWSNGSFQSAFISAFSGDGRSNAYLENLVDWVRGEDTEDADDDGSYSDQRYHMGDPLHSGPVSVTYGLDGSGNEDTVIFITTNEGFLHAIDADTGEEIFAFIPEFLYENFDDYYENEEGDHPYGLDGQITLHIIDGNQDGTISGNDKVYLYFGMRRGGNRYYALDVTSKASPSLMWIIDGNDSDFAELGQTWSQPTFGHIKLDTGVEDVLIIGGGYDTNQDNTSNTRSTDSMGRAIYMVEAGPADSGTEPTIVWKADSSSFPAMQYSIPSSVSAGDFDGDGYLDQMYVGDMGGQLWRFDITNGNSAANLVTGGVIATVAVDSDAAQARRFYNAPDVSILSTTDSAYLGIAIGSGWRANPLDTSVADQFYNFVQPLEAPDTYTSVGIDSLHNATQDLALSALQTLLDLETEAEADIAEHNKNIAEYQAQLDALDASDPSNDGKIDNLESLIKEEENAIAEEIAAVKEARADLDAERENYTNGWYVDFDTLGTDGEKVMASSVTLGGKIIFTTYEPTSAGNGCSAAQGKGRVYALSTFDASAVVDFDDDGDADRSTELLGYTIPPDPMIFIDGGDGQNMDTSEILLCFGTECGYSIDEGFSDRTYWLERFDLR